jgi:hypothetical protein
MTDGVKVNTHRLSYAQKRTEGNFHGVGQSLAGHGRNVAGFDVRRAPTCA